MLMKTCVMCGQTKPDEEFSRNNKRCKVCFRIVSKEYRQKRLEYYREYDRNRPNKAERVEKNKQRMALLKQTNIEKYRQQKDGATKRWRQRNKEKAIAEGRLNDAIRYGKIIRPTVCSCCGKEGKVEAHHYDYSKPLDVIWLCSECHHRKHVDQREKKREE